MSTLWDRYVARRGEKFFAPTMHRPGNPAAPLALGRFTVMITRR